MKKVFSKGFTLIEVTVAIFVLLVGVVGIYSILPKVILVSGENTDRFIASQLAREGIELIRNVRDTHWLEGHDWPEGLQGYILVAEMDYNDPAPFLYRDRYLKIDENGFYNYSSGQETKFKRKITLYCPTDDIIQVSVEVSWRGGSEPLVVRENLYRWK